MNHYEICHSSGYLNQVALMLSGTFDPANLGDRDAFISNQKIGELAGSLSGTHGLLMAAGNVEQIRAALRIGHEDGNIYKLSPGNRAIATIVPSPKPMFIEIEDGQGFSVAGGGKFRFFHGFYIDVVSSSFFNKNSPQPCLSIVAVNDRKVKERSYDDIYTLLVPIDGDLATNVTVAVAKNAEYIKAASGAETSDEDRESVIGLALSVIQMIEFIQISKFNRVNPSEIRSMSERIGKLKNKKKQRKIMRQVMKEDYFVKFEVAQ